MNLLRRDLRKAKQVMSCLVSLHSQKIKALLGWFLNAPGNSSSAQPPQPPPPQPPPPPPPIVALLLVLRMFDVYLTATLCFLFPRASCTIFITFYTV